MTVLKHEQARYYLHIGHEQLDPDECAKLDVHLAECVECQTYATELNLLQAGLSRMMQARWSTARPDPDLRNRIQASLQSHLVQRRVWGWASSLASVMVATGLVIVFVWVLKLTGPVTVVPATQVTATVLAIESTPQPPNVSAQITNNGKPFTGPAIFEGQIALLDFTLEDDHVLPGSAIGLRLRWEARAEIMTNYNVFVHVLAPDGGLVSQVDSLPVNGVGPMTSWLTGTTIIGRYMIPLPNDLAAGQYQLAAGMYDPTSGARLTTNSEESLVVLATVNVIPSTLPVSSAQAPTTASATSILVGASGQPVPSFQYPVGTDYGQVRLLGYDISGTLVVPGDSVSVTLYWQAQMPVTKSYRVVIGIVGAASGAMESSLPGSTLPTADWMPQAIMVDRYEIPVPRDVAGRYSLSVRLYDPVDQVYLSPRTGALPSSQSILLATQLYACPVTVPNGSTPPGEQPSFDHHGNGTLWTALWPDGKVLMDPSHVQPDGSLEMKFLWWRDVYGKLSIEGQRLDAPAPPLQVIIPEGYGETGLQASSLLFPSAGCWQVTGKAGNAPLTFVTLVVNVPQYPWMTPEKK